VRFLDHAASSVELRRVWVPMLHDSSSGHVRGWAKAMGRLIAYSDVTMHSAEWWIWQVEKLPQKARQRWLLLSFEMPKEAIVIGIDARVNLELQIPIAKLAGDAWTFPEFEADIQKGNSHPQQAIAYKFTLQPVSHERNQLQ
jgi:hypothetical protein